MRCGAPANRSQRLVARDRPRGGGRAPASTRRAAGDCFHPDARRRPGSARLDLIPLDGAAGRGRRPDPADGARAVRGHRAGLQGRADPGPPDAAGAAPAAPRGGARGGHGVRRRGARGLRRLAGPALPAGPVGRRRVPLRHRHARAPRRWCCETIIPILGDGGGARAGSRSSGGTHVPAQPGLPLPGAALVGGGRAARPARAARARLRRLLPARRAACVRGRGAPLGAAGEPRPVAPGRARGRARASRSRRALRGDVARRAADAARALLWEERRLETEWEVVELTADVARARSCRWRRCSRTAAPRSGCWASAGCGPRCSGSARCGKLLRFLDDEEAVVDPWLADQLAVPLALAGRRGPARHLGGDVAPRDGRPRCCAASGSTRRPSAAGAGRAASRSGAGLDRRAPPLLGWESR